MSSRIATHATGGPDSIRALIRSDPSVIQQGLRLLDFDIRTGSGGSLEAIGVDGSGSLALVVIARESPEEALARLLDGHLWAADQRDLIGRLYAGRGVDGDREARGFLLASSFTHGFLRRLSLLTAPVTPFLARVVGGGDGSGRAIVEPAAPLFGFAVVEGRAPSGAGPNDRQPFWPEGVLPSDETDSRGAGPVAAGTAAAPGIPAWTEVPGQAQEMPWPDAPEARFPWEIVDGAPEDAAANEGPPAAPLPPPDDQGPAGQFETLTIEEMDEFERFERQRLERGGRSS